MEAHRLVYMANQIGEFFKTYPHDQAVTGIAEHIRKFWDPRMRRQIFAELDTPENGMTPLVLEAVDSLAKAAKATAA